MQGVYICRHGSLAGFSGVSRGASAVELNKKIIPVRCDAGDDAQLPDALEQREWIYMRPRDDLEAGVARLVEALNSDLEWRDQLTDLADRARKWLDGTGDLLRGRDLALAEGCLVGQAEHRERPTSDQTEYVARSIQARKRAHRIRMFAVSAALVATSIAAVIALVQRHSAVSESHTIESQLLATEAPGKQDLALASLLAVDAYRLAPTVAARGAVLSVANSNELGAPLVGHTGQVDAVVFSPDSNTVVSAGTDGTIRFWSALNHRQLGPPIRTGSTVFSVAYSPDGRIIASGQDDHSIRLWDTTTHREIGAPLLGHSGAVIHVAFSRDGRLLASAGDDGTIRLWDVAARRDLGRPLRDGAPVLSVAFSPNGTVLASGDADGRIALWNELTHRQITLLGSNAYLLTKHGPTPSVAFSPDGQTLATASGNGMVWLWSIPAGREEGRLVTYNGEVISVAFSPDGQEPAAAGYANQITVWGLNVPAKRYVLTGHTNYVFSVAFSPNGQMLASGGTDRTVRLWKNAPPRLLGGIKLPIPAPATNAIISPDQRLVAASASDWIWLYSLPSGRQVGFLQGHSDIIFKLAFSPNGRVVASSSYDGTIRLWDVLTHRQIGSPITTGPCRGCLAGFIEGHRAFFGLSFSPTGRTLASSSADGTVRLWSVATHRELGAPIVSHTGTVQTVAFSPSGQMLASATGQQGEIRLWDVRTHLQIGAVMTANSVVRNVAFSPNGATLASADDDGTIRLWDITTHTQLGVPLTGHTRAVDSVEFSPDGKSLVSSSDDGSVRVWDVASHQQLGPSLTDFTDRPALSAALEQRYPGTRLLANYPVPNASFSPDGHTIVAANDVNGVGFWSNYPVSRYVSQVCAYINQSQARHLWGESEPGLAYRKPC